jgi:hypothetical protein
VLGEPVVVSAEEFAGMELDARVELIRQLIPLGLRAVEETLSEEVTRLAGARYSREGGQPGLARYGSRHPMPVDRQSQEERRRRERPFLPGCHRAGDRGGDGCADASPCGSLREGLR